MAHLRWCLNISWTFVHGGFEGLDADHISCFRTSVRLFVADGALVVRNFREHGPEPLIHALICSTFFVYCVARSHLMYYIPRFLFFELSTPFVHLRWFLHSLNLQKTKLYKINGLAMLGSFFACRMVLGTKLIGTFLPAMRRYQRLPPAVSNPIGPIAANCIRLLCCGTTCLNYFWFYKMLRGCFKVFVQKQQA